MVLKLSRIVVRVSKLIGPRRSLSVSVFTGALYAPTFSFQYPEPQKIVPAHAVDISPSTVLIGVAEVAMPLTAYLFSVPPPDKVINSSHSLAAAEKVTSSMALSDSP